MTRRAPLITLSLALLLLTVAPTGCMAPLFRGKVVEQQLDEIDPPGEPTTNFVSRYTHPYGLDYVQVQAVSLVTGLKGTGGDPPPTPQRAQLLEEMHRLNIERPNTVLAMPETALVLVRGFLRPGIQKGDRFDLEVRVPSKSETTSLRGGHMLSAYLTEMAVLGNSIRSGSTLAEAEGPVLVDPSAEGDDAGDTAVATRGRILGGGVALKSRPLGLVISHEHQSVRMAQAISKSINDRFHRYDQGRKVGVAKPKTDEFIELHIHPRYKDNITRFVKVVRSIAVSETSAMRTERLGRLEKQLLDPLTSAVAAIRLEAIGGERAIEILAAGLDSSDPEARFYSSEALAYLDDTRGADALIVAARDEPAFRVNALAALSAMDDVAAYEGLRSLLASKSAETRYGAFRSLWAMNAGDPMLRGERLGGQFDFHVLDVDGPPMIHTTRSFRPEIVLFGEGQQFQLPFVLDAGKDILVNGMTGDQIVVSRFAAGEESQKLTVGTDVDAVVRAIVQLGGGYPDVVQALQQANTDGALASRFCVDALPQTGREYSRQNHSSDGVESDADAEASDKYRVATPVPDLFSEQRQ
ncbi:flagellar basal body P-ring protein [Pseudobythopirellula maris]|uniref:Flagellar basal body P-ring protein n=1 Tax=Pseudobythopirellula maris TaxID=2527991 RepID=A0A5C5ZMF5_9BACT|nr:flagellar basal body P-ring protein FlgI [Pseudobythopirellula maris]TWT88589.1 flagellar basal body P-ring protein [Pseudobythopirellula maris]